MERKLFHILLRKPDTPLTEDQKSFVAEHFRFEPYFSARVMARLEHAYHKEREWLPGLTFAFSRVAVPVLVATIVLLAVIVFKEQTFSLDTLSGASGISMEDVVGNVFVSL
ncbi:MAG: hypothetical protein R3C61_05100 [Bacteroidia bacterium]